ncbi:hypothetical protein [Cupriavidus sp. CP313]
MTISLPVRVNVSLCVLGLRANRNRAPRCRILFVVVVASVLSALAPHAYASEFGCKVLLCLANPNGPKAADGCAPPIDQLYSDLRKGRSFPTCDEAGSAYAMQGYSW